MTLSPEQITALLQLSSPALPIGGFSYSQGLEAACEAGLVTDEKSAQHWIGQGLTTVLARCEAPIWCLAYDAWSKGDATPAGYWNDWFLASRESRELRAETEQMGWSLAKLAMELEWGPETLRGQFLKMDPLSLPVANAYAASQLNIPAHAGLTAYCFTWLENQVAAAVKVVPLGQVAGQRVLTALRGHIEAVCNEARQREAQSPPDLDTFAPQLAILSARHENQYSRLFRS